jgi:recombination protein RecA
MAKKKEAAESIVDLTPANVDAHLRKKFGQGIFVSGASILENPRMVIPVSPVLDMMLNGGIPEGSFCVSTGPPKVGKTTLWLDFAGTAQDMKYATDLCPKGRHVYFFNIEGRISDRDLAGIKTLNLAEDRFTCIKSEPGHILKAEEYLEILESYIHTKPGAIFVIDSFSQLCSGARFGSDYATRFRDDVPLMLADFCKKVSNVLPVNKCILLGVTHMIANQAAMAGQSPWSEASGRKIQYQMDVKLNAKYREFYPKEGNPIGQIVHWECFTSALGPPGRKGASFLRYNHGIDKVFELADLGKDLGMFEKGGSWFTMPDGSKVQGLENLVEYIRANNLFDHYYQQLQEMLGMK